MCPSVQGRRGQLGHQVAKEQSWLCRSSDQRKERARFRSGFLTQEKMQAPAQFSRASGSVGLVIGMNPAST